MDDFLLDEGGYHLATGDAYGAEFLIQYNYKRFNITASYTYSKSVHHYDGKTVNFIYDTPHSLNIFTSYETLKKDKRKHVASMNIGFKTGLPYMMSNTIYPGYDGNDDLINYPTYVNSRLTNFFRIDLNYTMEKTLKNGSRVWQISLLNATAHKNPYLIYYEDEKFKALQLIPILPSFSFTRYF